jgi:hypothetical protein
MDGWGRRYAPRTAHKSRFRRALKTQKHNPYSILTAQRSEQGSAWTLAVAAAYVPYVVAKLLQMMLLNYASLKLCFA